MARNRMIPAIFMVCLLGMATARAEMIRELVTIQGAVPIPLHGQGIVTGLSNTGDQADAALRLLRYYLSINTADFDLTSLATGGSALVRVTAEIDPFARPGHRLPVTVTAMNDATSLKGGELLYCNLTNMRGEEMAQAYGQVVVGNDSLTRGRVLPGQSSGAMLIGGNPLNKVMSGKGIIRLNLNRANWADASAIARQINQTPSLNPYLQEAVMFADAAPSQPVAYVRDMGQVVVVVPEQYRHIYPTYLADLLEVPVSVDRPARIVVNRAKNSIVVTGDIRVSNAVVSLQDKMVTIRPETPEDPAMYVLEDDTPRNLIELDGPGTYADLQGLIDTLNSMGLTTDQVITVFEQLRASGAINAELINE